MTKGLLHEENSIHSVKILFQTYTVRKDPLNDLGALMFLKNVLKFGLKNSEE